MKKNYGKDQCPECGSTEFVVYQNTYDVCAAKDGEFITLKTELAEDPSNEYSCRNCGRAVNISATFRRGRVVLRPKVEPRVLMTTIMANRKKREAKAQNKKKTKADAVDQIMFGGI